MTIYTLRSGGTAHPENILLQMLTEQVTVGGVIDLSSTNNLKVSEKGAGADMSVDIAVGKAFVRKTGTNTYPVYNDAIVNKLVGANASGNPRIDSIVLYIDLAASANATSTNVATFAVVAGTPAASPSAPDDTAIGTAIGASNPYIVLADIAVANGASSITNANITDRRARYKTRHTIHEGNATDGATTTYDVSVDNYIHHTLGGNRTLAITGATAEDSFMIELIQPSSGGPYTVTWWSNIDWADGIAPVLSTTASRADVFGFIKLASGRYRGFVLGQNLTTS